MERLVDRQIQTSRFMRCSRVGLRKPSAGPMPKDLGDKVTHRAICAGQWSKVKSRRKFLEMCLFDVLGRNLVPKFLTQQQISTQWLQHMLPGTGRVFVTHKNRLRSLQRTNAIRKDSIGGPVTTADNVPGSRTRNSYPPSILISPEK